MLLAGGFISRIRRLFISKREVRMLMNGLDAAGKTTILYKLKLGEIVTTIPTIGFNVETVEYRNIAFTVWDVGGRDKIRPLWRHYYQNTVRTQSTTDSNATSTGSPIECAFSDREQRDCGDAESHSWLLSFARCAQNALIWVVDSNDRDRLDNEDYGGTTKDELHKALAEDELRDAPLLVFANKQDLPNAMKVQEITERLGLNKLRNRQWFIQGCCATSGDGLYEGLEWLSEAVKRQVVTPSQRNQYTAPIPVAAPVYVPPIEPQPRKAGPLGVMDAISSDNPNAFAAHALAPVAAPAVATAASASSLPTPGIMASRPPSSYSIETVKADPVLAARALGYPVPEVGSRGTNLNGVPRAPPLISARRFVAPRAPVTPAAALAPPSLPSMRAPVSSRLFPSFPPQPEDAAHLRMQSAAANLESMLKRRRASMEPASELVVVGQPKQREDGEVSVVIEKRARHPSFDLKHSPLVSLQVRYPLSEIDHPLSKSEALINGLTLDSPPSTPPRKRSAVVADSEFVIVERIEEEDDMVIVPHAQTGENKVRLTMVEC